MSTSTDAPQPAARRDETTPRRRRIPAPYVFWPALGIIVTAVLLAGVFPESTEGVLTTVQNGVVAGFGPYFVLVATAFVVFCLVMGLSRFGDIKLGKDDDQPEFGLLSWFAMLFAAGMGIGLVFFGAAEPLTFFVDPKPGVSGDRVQLAEAAMSQTFLHWGFHAWAIYAVIGLGVAYSIHRKGNPVSIRWALEPLLGDRVKGGLGNAIDVIAVVGTLFGVATSLGLGVQQISAGLEHLGVVDEASSGLMLVLIAIITAIATISVISGVGKGIKWLSNINMVMAGVFLVALFLLGPTLYFMRDMVQSAGVYLQNIIQLSLNASTFTSQEGLDWQSAWTLFYWGWWISWAPFVGVFIARISRGRTVREFVGGVLLVPTVVTVVWFSVLGGGAIRQAWDDFNGGLFDEAEGVVSEKVLFDYLGGMPGGVFFVLVAMALVAIFFITSSDSGSLVVTMLSSGGDPDPPRWSRVMWAVLEGAVAIALLLAGGLTALQTGAILTAIPVSIVMLAMCLSIYKAFRAEHSVLIRAERRQRRDELAIEIEQGLTDDFTENFDDRFGEQVDHRIDASAGSRRGSWLQRALRTIGVSDVREPGTGGPPAQVGDGPEPASDGGPAREPDTVRTQPDQTPASSDEE